MQVTDALYGEHGSIYLLMKAIEARLPGADLATLQSSAALFEATIVAHASFEDDPLFGALERVMPGGGPVAVMRAEHESIERELSRVATSHDADEARRHIEAALAEARSHFLKEEVVLFPLAEQMLGAEALEEMGADWARHRGVALPTTAGAAGSRR